MPIARCAFQQVSRLKIFTFLFSHSPDLAERLQASAVCVCRYVYAMTSWRVMSVQMESTVYDIVKSSSTSADLQVVSEVCHLEWNAHSASEWASALKLPAASSYVEHLGLSDHGNIISLYAPASSCLLLFVEQVYYMEALHASGVWFEHVSGQPCAALASIDLFTARNTEQMLRSTQPPVLSGTENGAVYK